MMEDRIPGSRCLMTTVCVLLVIGFSFSSGQTTPRNVMCNYNAWWKQLWGDGFFNVSDIDISICTHLVYYDASINNDMTIWAPDAEVKLFEQIQELRPSNPSLKVILSVSFDKYDFAPALQDKTLIKNTIDSLRSFKFDGVDILWDDETISPALLTFIELMKAAFTSEETPCGLDPLILMLTVHGKSAYIGEDVDFQNGKSAYIGEDVDFQRLTEAVDIFHVITAQYGGFWNALRVTVLNAPLYGHKPDGLDRACVSESVNYYLDAGMVPEKLHITIQFYATTFTLSDPQLTGVGAPTDLTDYFGGPSEYLPSGADFISYFEVCKRLQEYGYTEEWDPEGQVPFAYKGDQWMTYENPASLDIKVDYVIENNLGGVVASYLSADDYSGYWNQGKYPLLTTLYRLAFQRDSNDNTTA